MKGAVFMKRWRCVLAVMLASFLLLMPLSAVADSGGYDLSVLAPGDLSGDGQIDALDALMILQRTVLLLAPDWGRGWHSYDGLRIADLDGDCKITVGDALLILQYQVKLIDSFPPRDLALYQEIIQSNPGFSLSEN